MTSLTRLAYQQLIITSLPHNPQTQLETREFLLEKRVAPLKSSTKRGIPWLWRQMQMKNSSNSARFALDTADHRGDEQWQKRDRKCFNSISWFSNETQNCSAVQGSCSVLDGKDERKLFFSSQFLALHEEKNAATKLHSREVGEINREICWAKMFESLPRKFLFLLSLRAIITA